MEEYLQCMKTLRSQMNDVEEQAAKVSVDEQINITTIQTLEKDLDLAKVEIKRLKEETSKMTEVKGQICSEILKKQRKNVTLESDSSTLSQSLELILQEKGSLSAKLVEKSTYYAKVLEDIRAGMKEQQDWINGHKKYSLNGKNGVVGLGQDKNDEKHSETKGSHDDMVKRLMGNLDAVQVKFDQLKHQKSGLVSECNKMKDSVDLVHCKIKEFKGEIREMDAKSLDEELQALRSDKSGEIEYMQSLQHQISKLKKISNLVKCSCGEVFNVELGHVHE